MATESDLCRRNDDLGLCARMFREETMATNRDPDIGRRTQ
jgi:hypothetical protein